MTTQRDGRWPHLWRVAGRYANVSILDVGSVDELHELLSGLPLFPYLDIRVTAPGERRVGETVSVNIPPYVPA